jgi:release factor glutamine methyltransferase
VSPLDAVRSAERELAAAGVPSPRTDAELLVAQILGRTRTELYARDGGLSDEQRALLAELVGRRGAREPLAYILGEWGFRRLMLTVDDRVLVPRPETEVLVERALALVAGLETPRVVDVGTGSGAIALAIAAEHPGAAVLGIDLSAEALEVAAENRRRNGLDARVTFARTDLLDGLAGPVDLVVSNPPYIGEGEMHLADPEVRDWEPRLAVLGAGIAEQIAADARAVLRGDGAIALECGDGQADHLAARLGRLGYRDVRVTADLAARDRIVEGRL